MPVISPHLGCPNSQLKGLKNVLVGLLRRHVTHEVVDEFLHPFDVLRGVCLVLQANDVVGHLHLELPGRVMVLEPVSRLHRVLQVEALGRLLKILPCCQHCHDFRLWQRVLNTRSWLLAF